MPEKPSETDPHAQRNLETRIVQLDPQRDMATRIVQAPPLPPELRERQALEKERSRGASRGASKASGKGAGTNALGRLSLELEESALSRDIDALLERLRYTYSKLDRIDRLLCYSLGATFIAAFLPWISVPDYGLLAGIQDGYGILAGLFGAIGFFAFGARAWRRLRGGLRVLLELVGAFGVAATSLYRAITLEGTPAWGLYVSVVAAVAAFLFGLVRLVR